MRTIQLYGSAGAGASDVAHVTIPSAGKIRGIQYSLTVDQEADADVAIVELSKIPTSQIAVNGSQEPFFSVRTFNNLVTSGMTQSSISGFVPLNVDVRQGEIIYLHAQLTASTFYFNAILSYE